jgi:hypothetical protein
MAQLALAFALVVLLEDLAEFVLVPVSVSFGPFLPTLSASLVEVRLAISSFRGGTPWKGFALVVGLFHPFASSWSVIGILYAQVSIYGITLNYNSFYINGQISTTDVLKKAKMSLYSCFIPSNMSIDTLAMYIYSASGVCHSRPLSSPPS